MGRCRLIQVGEMTEIVPGLDAGGTPALPGSHHVRAGSHARAPGLHPMTSLPQGYKIAEAFWGRLWLKEVHLYSCVFVFIRGSSSLNPKFLTHRQDNSFIFKRSLKNLRVAWEHPPLLERGRARSIAGRKARPVPRAIGIGRARVPICAISVSRLCSGKPSSVRRFLFFRLAESDGWAASGLAGPGFQILVIEQQRSQGLPQMPMDVIGQQAQEQMSPYPRLHPMTDGTDVQVDGLQRTEGPLHPGQEAAAVGRRSAGSLVLR